jgi:murein DD-endopeptidase MepM/ murein hydrolase activator NlpD
VTQLGGRKPCGRCRSRQWRVLLGTLFLVSLSIAAVSGVPAGAQTTDTTTTVPPDTTTTQPPPTTTTTTVPPATTTTQPPSDTTTTLPPDTTTTSPTTTVPPNTGPEPGKLYPGEALVPEPEFGALTEHQRALVDELQTATDAYALNRFGQFALAHELAAAKDALKQAQAAENAVVKHEIVSLANALSESNRPTQAAARRLPRRAAVDARVAAFRALSRRLEDDRNKVGFARIQVQSTVDDLSERLAALTRAVDDASAARTEAQSGIEQELGPDAVRARPDGITATLASAQAGQPDPIVIGGLELPIPGAPLASPFGLRNDPLSGGAGFHPGIDLGASSGTPIHAAAAGVVVTAGDCGGYGNCVVIDHGTSLATVYAHQSSLNVQVGETVDAGQVIGLVGSTGLATGPHLHFEVRLHGIPIDPLLALAGPVS